MKRIIPILSTLLALLICSACTNADEPDTQKSETEKKDNYYVRYEISNGSAFPVRGNVATEKGNLDFSGKFNETFGPVPKGFRAYAYARFYHEGRGGSTNYNIRIYVSKNTEPFVLKSQKSGTFPDGGSDEASYTIDF